MLLNGTIRYAFVTQTFLCSCLSLLVCQPSLASWLAFVYALACVLFVSISLFLLSTPVLFSLCEYMFVASPFVSSYVLSYVRLCLRLCVCSCVRCILHLSCYLFSRLSELSFVGVCRVRLCPFIARHLGLMCPYCWWLCARVYISVSRRRSQLLFRLMCMYPFLSACLFYGAKN